MEKLGDILGKSIPTLPVSGTKKRKIVPLSERQPIRRAGELTKLQQEMGVVIPSASDPSRNAECLRCRDAGWVTRWESETMPCVAVPCPDCTRATEGEDKTNRMLRLSGIPDARMEYNFQSFKNRAGTGDAHQAALNLALGTTETKWLLLYGGLGSGKTHLAIAAGVEIVRRGIVVKFIKVADMLSDFRRAMNMGEISCDDLIKYYKDVECLILDDIGVEHETDWSISKLEEIITSRYETKKYLIATTNKDINELPDRIRSRFLDPDLSVVARNIASDYRARR